MKNNLYNRQGKNDSDLPLGSCQEPRSFTGEDNLQREMPVKADNPPADTYIPEKETKSNMPLKVSSISDVGQSKNSTLRNTSPSLIPLEVPNCWKQYLDNRLEMIINGDFTRNLFFIAGITYLTMQGYETEIYREIGRRIYENSQNIPN